MNRTELGQAKEGVRIQRVFGIPFDFSLTGVVGQAYSSKYTISTSYNFLWEITNLYRSGTTPRDFTLNIRDEFTSEDMFVSPVYVTMIAGNGQLQNILPRPYVFMGGTTITLSIVDVLGGSAMTSQILLQGYKIK